MTSGQRHSSSIIGRSLSLSYLRDREVGLGAGVLVGGGVVDGEGAGVPVGSVVVAAVAVAVPVGVAMDVGVDVGGA